MTIPKTQVSCISINSRSRFKKELILCLTTFSLVFTQVKLNQNLSSSAAVRTEPPLLEGRAINSELFKILSFGNLPMALDYLTILVLGDPALDKVSKSAHPISFFYLKAIGELDPMFSELGALANMLAVVRGDGLGARELLDRSQRFVKDHLAEYPETFRNKYWPHPWQGQIFLGYVNIFELDDLPRAAIAFQEAAAMPGSPKYLSHLKQNLTRPGGQYEVGLKLLKFLISGAKDEKYRISLEKKLHNLTISEFIFKINLAFQTFVESQRISAFKPGFSMDKQKLTAQWAKFLKTTSTSTLDPWGGQLYLNDQRKIASTTPYEKVFGLD